MWKIADTKWLDFGGWDRKHLEFEEVVNDEKVLVLGGTGLVGKRIVDSIKDTYEVIITSGHHKVDDGYVCLVDDIIGLSKILEVEQPDIVVSSLRGDFNEQMQFHEALAEWIRDNNKRMVYISTLNVFDGNLSFPVDENTLPYSDSEYGKFKIECEKMLQQEVKGNLAILRLGVVWDKDCKRIERLRKSDEECSVIETYTGLMITQTLASQVGEYTKYILDNSLNGIFHVGAEDMVDYHQFELKVCNRLHITCPKFQIEEMGRPTYQAFLPSIRDIPLDLRITVNDVLDAISKNN